MKHTICSVLAALLISACTADNPYYSLSSGADGGGVLCESDSQCQPGYVCTPDKLGCAWGTRPDLTNPNASDGGGQVDLLKATDLTPATDLRLLPDLVILADLACNANTQSDPQNCGKCGNVCSMNHIDLPLTCTMGKCQSFCTSSYANCNGMVDKYADDADGCETDNRVDVHHCGNCATDCIQAGKQACVKGLCQ